MKLHFDWFKNQCNGFWLPADPRDITDWVNNMMIYARQDTRNKCLDSTLVDLQVFINGNEYLRTLANDMFTEIPCRDPYRSNPVLKPNVHNFEDMLCAFNMILKSGPSWNNDANERGIIGFPINAVLAWPAATAAGYALFLHHGVNVHIEKILNKWAKFLQSSPSTEVLRPPKGWLGRDGLHSLTAKGNEHGLCGRTEYEFNHLYHCPNPNDPDTLGFASWDAFFTRKVNPETRPIAEPNNDAVIAHACEATPVQHPSSGIQRTDNFMGKTQRYSLENMLHNDPLVGYFVGGTVYQAFLNALTYHRWHAPINGKVKKAYNVQGTYYAEDLWAGFQGEEGFNPVPDADPPNKSQIFIASMAARALIFLEADDPAIGIICFIGIGMAEVSSCDITVREGQKVQKGDEIGLFHYGGSSYCLVFRPGLELEWSLPNDNTDIFKEGINFPVNGKLATVKNKTT